MILSREQQASFIRTFLDAVLETILKDAQMETTRLLQKSPGEPVHTKGATMGMVQRGSWGYRYLRCIYFM